MEENPKPPANSEVAIAQFSRRRRDAARPILTVVVPIYNEEANVQLLHERLEQTLKDLDDSYEILFIDDGSTDSSLRLIRDLHGKHGNVRYASFSRNFGHEAATTCGLMRARGQAVVLIDADLQDPPELILELLDRWRTGSDLVYAQRRERDGETWFTRMTSHLFYRLLNRIASVDIPVDTGDFRLMDRKVVDCFCELPERNRFVRGMTNWVGFPQSSVVYDRSARFGGETKYNFTKRLRLAFDAICSMSSFPLRCVSFLGVCTTAVSLLIAAAVVVHRLFFGLSISGYALATSGIYLLGGIQLLCLGLIGEYVGRIYTESQGRPLFVVAEEGQSGADGKAPSTSHDEEEGDRGRIAV